MEKYIKLLYCPQADIHLKPIFLMDFTFHIKNATRYVVVAEGGTLPNIAKIENKKVFGYKGFDNPDIKFTLNQEKEILVGFVAILQINRKNFRCYHVRLLKIN